MSDEFSPADARLHTFRALRRTVVFLHQNKDMVQQMLRSLGAPDDDMAEGFHAQMMELLIAISESVKESPDEAVLDASKLPGVEILDAKGLH